MVVKLRKSIPFVFFLLFLFCLRMWSGGVAYERITLERTKAAVRDISKLYLGTKQPTSRPAVKERFAYGRKIIEQKNEAAHDISNFFLGTKQHTPGPKNITKENISCEKLISGDEIEIERSRDKVFSQRKTSTEGLKNSTRDCQNFISSRGYITKVTPEEAKFPVAFTILMYRDPEQVERLLRAIYRPQNYYCIHVDKKAPAMVHKAMAGIVNCLKNVFIAPSSIKVYWGTIGTLTADMICMEFLWKLSAKWKYYINLTGQEYPLKTNYELVKILQAYNGSNLIGGKVRKWGKRKTMPPHGLKLMKGSFHIIASRGYVDFVMTSPVAKDLFDWVEKNVKVPDEAFYCTLNYNPKLSVPGSYKQGNPGTTVSHIRYKVWYKKKQCAGKMVRGICVFGVGDLPVLTNRTEQFANKFQYQYQPLVYDCMEEWLNEKVRKEQEGNLSFDNSFYKTLPFVVNKI